MSVTEAANTRRRSSFRTLSGSAEPRRPARFLERNCCVSQANRMVESSVAEVGDIVPRRGAKRRESGEWGTRKWVVSNLDPRPPATRLHYHDRVAEMQTICSNACRGTARA